MVVAHNLYAMNAQRQYNLTGLDKQKSTEKLSSGYQINRAADNAAGLSISEKMRKQIRGLGRASTNAQDGISMVQTADGALEEVHGMLQRMNELCVQAANGTNSTSDRRAIQDEIDEINREIDRVAASTKFNEINLLDGSIANPGGTYRAKLQRARVLAETEKKLDKYYESLKSLNGKDTGKEYSLGDIQGMDGTKILYSVEFDGVTTTPHPSGNIQDSSVSAAQMNDVISSGFLNSVKTEIVPQAINNILNAYPNAFNYLQGSVIGMGLRLYNDSSSATMASMGLSAAGGSSGIDLGYTLSINLAYFDLSGGSIPDGTRDKLEHTVVHEMVHAFMEESMTRGMLGWDGVSSQNENEKYPLWFVEGMAQSASGPFYDAADWMMSIGVTPTASVSSIQAQLANNPISSNSNSASHYASGYLACMYLGYLASGRAGYSQSALARGVDTVLNKVRNGSTLNSVIKEYTGKNINQFEADFPRLGAEFARNLANYVQQGTGGLATNAYASSMALGIGGSTIIADANPGINMQLFELNTGASIVYNTYPAGYDIFTGGFAGYVDAEKEDADAAVNDMIAEYIANRKPTGFGTALHVGAESAMNNKLLVYIDAMDSYSIGTSDINVMSEKGATLSIEKVALAIAQVSEQRSELGAYQNRLEYTIRNLDNVTENTTAAESRIRDTDMAKEMVNYSKSSILEQVGQSMIAQANQQSQGVLSLLS